MSGTKRISSALISVFHKDGLDEIINKLHEEGVKLISTGGTQRFIESLGVPCQPVARRSSTPDTLPQSCHQSCGTCQLWLNSSCDTSSAN